MKIDGACHCGRITYEAEVDPNFVGLCHCTDCQTLSGTAFSMVALAKHGGFTILTGDPKVYFRTTEKGEKRKRAFCEDCGTPIYAADLSESPLYSIRVGTARQRDQLIPKIQIWCRSAQGWVGAIDRLPKFEKQPPLPGK
jgi:hypothetical protein